MNPHSQNHFQVIAKHEGSFLHDYIVRLRSIHIEVNLCLPGVLQYKGYNNITSMEFISYLCFTDRCH